MTYLTKGNEVIHVAQVSVVGDCSSAAPIGEPPLLVGGSVKQRLVWKPNDFVRLLSFSLEQAVYF